MAPGSVIPADEAAHWDLMEADFDLQRIIHSKGYSLNGTHINPAESVF
ncbi:transposase [Leisingera methylohalidivorans]